METIAHLNAPIDEEHLAHFQKILQAHGATLHKIRTEDDDRWWTILLPEGTTRQERLPRVQVPRYHICFPDGYWFLFEAGVLNRQGIFTRDPVISLDPPADAKTPKSRKR
jgi:hypothetical protein